MVAPASAPRAGIVVSGGSSAAGLGLYRAAAEAARLRPEWGWRILVGQRLPEADFAALGEGLPAGTVVRARPDFRALLSGAALVGQPGGLQHRDRSPGDGHPRRPRPLRGRARDRAAGPGRVPRRARPRPGAAGGRPQRADPHRGRLRRARRAAARGDHGIDLDGAARSVAIIESLAAERRARPAEPRSARAPEATPCALPSMPRPSAARPFPCGGATTTPSPSTPALDTLLSLSERHGAPDPDRGDPGAQRGVPGRADRASPEHRVAVHGLSHANHAPPGVKPAEFGPHRPHAALIADAAEALRLARRPLRAEACCRSSCRPGTASRRIWETALARLGYAGLSAAEGAATAGARAGGRPSRSCRLARKPQPARSRPSPRPARPPDRGASRRADRPPDASPRPRRGDLGLPRRPPRVSSCAIRRSRRWGRRTCSGRDGWRERRTARPAVGACA